ncbi:MAG: polyprenol monophosphomannose synthase [Chloroflexi bacterium]|nr:polyprenol monophosphomannose synthase [Chloroflexota bacterium]
MQEQPAPAKVIVVLPTYNEAENLPLMVQQLRALGIPSLRVLVVDDNSPDGTGPIADRLRRDWPDFVLEPMHRPAKAGLGTAYIAGFRRALREGADYVIQMDTDFSHPVEAIPRMLEAIKDADVVIGSRYTEGGRLDPSWGMRRRALSRGGNLFARWRNGLRVKDATGGFRCFRRNVLEQLPFDQFRAAGFSFQLETVYYVERKGFRLVEIPILFRDRTQGQSKMSLRIIAEAFWRAWEMKGRF